MTGVPHLEYPGATAGVDFRKAQRRVAPFMLLAAAALLTGLWAGLDRMGWEMPGATPSLQMRHGGLMVIGFVVTVVAVERAVAVRSLPAFAAPALSAATGFVLITNAFGGGAGPALAFAAGVAYAVNVAVLLYRHRLPPFVIALLGSIGLVVAGAVWWSGGGISEVVPWWAAFLVLTIAAERLEILRFRRFTVLEAAAGAAAFVLILAGAGLSLVSASVGARVLGIGLGGLAAWLLTRDIALRTVRTDGLSRYAAVGLLSAYAWLIAGGVLLLVRGLSSGGLGYDAVIHTIFIGFVFSAIMAHEPIIAPAVTGLRFSYTPLLYVPLLLLNAGLVFRVGADLAENADVRRWAGMAQALAILLFLALSVGTVLLSRRRSSRRTLTS